MTNPTPMRVIFMGSPAFALPALEAVMNAGHEIAGVYAQPPRPAGRGQRLTPCPVHAFADAKGLPVFVPLSLRTKESEQMAELRADIAVVVAYGLILPKKILALPRLGCVNLHPSILPRWRGAAPIQRSIQAGDTETAATIMQMDEGCDTGPVLLYKKTPILPEDTTVTLSDRLSTLGAELMVHALTGLQHGVLKPIEQAKEGVTYARKLEKEDGRLDWMRPAHELDCLVRALNPWPMAFFDCNGERIKVLKAKAVPAKYSRLAPGTVLTEDGQLAIVTRDGMLRLDELQRPNRHAGAALDVLRNLNLPDGAVLAA